MKKTEPIKEQLIELRAKGYSFAKIAEQLNISKPTAISWSRELELEINNRKMLELDSLYEQYKITKTNRIQHLAEDLNKITEELHKRTYEDIPTIKLLEIKTKVLSEIKDETIPLRLKEHNSTIELDIYGTKSWEI